MPSEWMRLGVVLAVALGGMASSATAQDEALPEATQPATPPAQPEETQQQEQPPAAQPPPGATVDVRLSGAPVSIETIDEGTLVLKGTEQDLAILEKVIALLDRGTAPLKPRIFRLSNAQAGELAQTLQRLLQQMALAGGRRTPRPEDEVYITPDLRTNSLIVAATEEKLAQLSELISQLDQQPAIGEVDFHTYPLKYLQAAEAEQRLREFLEKLQQQRGGTGPAALNIIADPRRNALIITAPKSELDPIRKYLDLIDVEPVGQSKAVLVMFPLTKAKASDLARILQEMFTTQRSQAEAVREQIRRLRLLLSRQGEDVENLPELNLERPIRILADEGTNSLIVGMTEDNIAPMREVVRLLDQFPTAEEVAIRVFPLEHADADAVRDLLVRLFEEGKSLPIPPGETGRTRAVPEGVSGKAMVYNIAVAADARTNVLVVAGRIEQVLLAQQIIGQLDQPAAATRYPFELIPAGPVSAARAYEILNDLFEKRAEALKAQKVSEAALARERVFLAVEEHSNSLIVSGPPDSVREVRELVDKLGQVPDRWSENIRILPMKQGSAPDIAEKITKLWESRAREAEGKGGPLEIPVIVSDARSNSLIIASSERDFEAIRALVAKIEAQPLSPLAEIYVIPLRYNDAGEVARSIDEIFQKRLEMRVPKGEEPPPSDRVAVVADAGTNALIVTCNRENYQTIQGLLARIDVEVDVEGLVRTFILQHARAKMVAERIQDLFSQGIVRPSAAGETEQQKRRDRVAIVADERANALIVSASRQNFSIIERLIQEMDVLDFGRLRGMTQIFEVQHGDVVRMAEMLTRLFEGIAKQQDTQDVFVPPTIIADDRSNTLIVSGSKDALMRAADLIARLDRRPVSPSAEFRVYSLRHGSAATLAPLIQDLFDKRTEGGAETPTGVPIYVQADPASNSLIVTAGREDHAILEGLLKLLDVPSTLDQLTRIFPLQRGRAEDLAERLNELFESQQRAGDGGRRAQSASITADPRTNSLIVVAAPAMMDNIASIIERLDTAMPTREVMIEVIHLEQALAEDLAEVLSQALGAAGGAPGRGRQPGAGPRRGATEEQAMFISFLEKDPAGVERLRKLLKQDLTIIAEPRTNSLIVTAPPDSMDMLRTLIRKLDSIKPEIAEIRVFPLVNASAEEMKNMLDELFETERQRGARRAGEGEAEQQLAFGDVIGAPGRQRITFTVDPRTNAIIAAGTPHYLDLAEDLVRQLDSQAIDERVSLIYAVRHGTAETIAEALSQFNQEQAAKYERLTDEAARQRQIEREISVIASDATNTLLVDVDPRRESEVMRLVQELDRPVPQVMIQVLLAEVSFDDRLELGIEFAAQDLLFSETGNDFDFVIGTDVGAAGSGALGGFTFTISGEDFNFLLRTLESEGRLQVLSRPSILARDNVEARIQVANRVPFVSAVNITEAGQTQSTIQYQDVGIILAVTPHINPDGFVNLQIAPEISNITPSSVTITEGLTAPIFAERSAETEVTVMDGETVVLGGLIQTREEQNESKVPILGDLPLIGILFRATSYNVQKSELLIVLTPRVVRSVEDLHGLSVEERDRTSLTEEILRHPSFEGLRLRPGERRLGPVEETPPAGGPSGPATTMPAVPEYAPMPERYGPDLSAIDRHTPAPGESDPTAAAVPVGLDAYLQQQP